MFTGSGSAPGNDTMASWINACQGLDGQQSLQKSRPKAEEVKLLAAQAFAPASQQCWLATFRHRRFMFAASENLRRTGPLQRNATAGT